MHGHFIHPRIGVSRCCKLGTGVDRIGSDVASSARDLRADLFPDTFAEGRRGRSTFQHSGHAFFCHLPRMNRRTTPCLSRSDGGSCGVIHNLPCSRAALDVGRNTLHSHACTGSDGKVLCNQNSMLSVEHLFFCLPANGQICAILDQMRRQNGCSPTSCRDAKLRPGARRSCNCARACTSDSTTNGTSCRANADLLQVLLVALLWILPLRNAASYPCSQHHRPCDRQTKANTCSRGSAE
mmetsp:Transcript_52829/g.150615  ORF Transcript_52829/g.150615 Transcript_52829/m.150615 type:complete len:239 (+) Transcript_52829:738-1454(+)